MQERISLSDNTAGWSRRHERSRARGFTLIEILIVISIIALLSSFVLVAITKGKQGAAEAVATTQISSLSGALERFVDDEATYPGIALDVDPERNDFPLLYNALFGERRPRGPGGRSAPYMTIKEDQISVLDEITGEYRQAKKAEKDNSRVEKFLMDPWGEPYIYRVNKGKRRESYMHNYQGADIYSTGPNGVDDTILEEENSDDIGNW